MTEIAYESVVSEAETSAIEPIAGDDFDQFVRDDDEASILQQPPRLTMIKVGRPPKQSFVCFSAKPEHRFNVTCVAYRDEEGVGDRAFYPILQALAPLVLDSVTDFRFALYVTLKGTPGLWPINMRRDSKGEFNSWTESALTIVDEYAEQWIRVVANTEAGGYEVIPGNYPSEPRWPELSPREIFDLAFGKKLIKDEGHPLIQHLLGRR